MTFKHLVLCFAFLLGLFLVPTAKADCPQWTNFQVTGWYTVYLPDGTFDVSEVGICINPDGSQHSYQDFWEFLADTYEMIYGEVPDAGTLYWFALYMAG